ncbi:hypothetical protein ACLQ24_30190, partial [Micromonospora sp. DT4]
SPHALSLGHPTDNPPTQVTPIAGRSKVASFGVQESKSIVPPALEAFASSGRAVFKFVASSVSDLDRIAELAAAYQLTPVWVMPEGTTPGAIIAATRVLADAVAARHWHFTTRLHVLAFADTRGR